MGKFLEWIEQGKTLEEIADYLDSLTHAQRLEEMRDIHKGAQEKLFSMAQKNLALEDLIPATTPPHQEVIFYGRNSLPLFNSFQKRMCRSQDFSGLSGYNHQSMQWLTGPGYFIVGSDSDRNGELMVDYTEIPQDLPPAWPAFRSNDQGVSKLVYGQLKDFLRRVSKNIFIGQATKKDKTIGYFLLCRE